jgi:hypothetical protein
VLLDLVDLGADLLDLLVRGSRAKSRSLRLGLGVLLGERDGLAFASALLAVLDLGLDRVGRCWRDQRWTASIS